jgi:thioredoxin-related protein
MKTVLILLLALGLVAPTMAQTAAVANAAAPKIEWLTWDEAAKRMEKQPRKIMVDVYTDWCGWCKRMDATTMTDPGVIKVLNTQYYAVKMDGEYKQDILFKGRTYKFINNGRRGYHELPAELMNGQMSYPTLVFLDEEFGIIQPLPGYQEPRQLEPILAYFGGNFHKNTPWDKFQQSYKGASAQ